MAEKIRLGTAIYNIRILLNERAADVIKRDSVRTTDKDILFFIKSFLWQHYSSEPSDFDDGDDSRDINAEITALAIPSGVSVDPDVNADTDTNYPNLPIKVSAVWKMTLGVFRFFNTRNETSSRPEIVISAAQTVPPNDR